MLWNDTIMSGNSVLSRVLQKLCYVLSARHSGCQCYTFSKTLEHFNLDMLAKRKMQADLVV